MRIRTHYDHFASPQHAEMQIFDQYIHFTWQHSCRFRNEHPSYYLMRIHDLVLNKSEVREIDGLEYDFDDVKMGAEYKFELSAPAPNAAAFVWNYTAPMLPTPSRFNATIHQHNSTIYFDWNHIDYDAM